MPNNGMPNNIVACSFLEDLDKFMMAQIPEY
jgi:hypothetical protein